MYCHGRHGRHDFKTLGAPVEAQSTRRPPVAVVSGTVEKSETLPKFSGHLQNCAEARARHRFSQRVADRFVSAAEETAPRSVRGPKRFPAVPRRAPLRFPGSPQRFPGRPLRFLPSPAVRRPAAPARVQGPLPHTPSPDNVPRSAAAPRMMFRQWIDVK